MSDKDAEKKQEEKKETSDERNARVMQKIKEIEQQGKKDIPQVNYKWYELGTQICIEIYEKGLQEGEISARIDESDCSILYITVKGQEHKFDLFGEVADVKFTIRKTKAEIMMNSISVPSHFPVLLKCEGKINAAKEKKYAELDKLGKEDTKEGLNDFFQGIFNRGTDEQKKAMVKSMKESGGTVLSTDWKDVGAKKVEPRRGDEKHDYDKK